MKIIGLCGGSGCGKGTVCLQFLNYDIPSIDTDAVYHEITSHDSSCMRALVDEFGECVTTERGGLDRSRLREIIFGDGDSSSCLKRLNEITHGYILDETRRRISDYEKMGKKFVIVDAPLLFESGFDSECQITICVTAPIDTRIERIVARDGISPLQAEKRIKSQISDDILRTKCDYEIVNEGNIQELEKKISALVNILNENY